MAHQLLQSPTIVAPQSCFPLMLSVPHSGHEYPDWLVASAAGGLESLQSLEDPLVDKLALRALALGVGAVVARAPRAAVDCNRAPDEIDPLVVSGAAVPCSARAQAGLGVVPGRTARHGHLWREPITLADLEERIATAHAPYHAAIERALDRLAIIHGAALLLDCHSMPPRRGQAQIVIGDRHGSTADPRISAAVASIARAQGWTVALNQPYAGGHIVDRHGDPVAGIHALQIEIDRSCYLAKDQRTAGPGFDRAAHLLESLVVGLSRVVGQVSASESAAE
ncbi:MAG: N-formylglutamate amidohydrolase [Sphingomicrobium sp.]